MLHFSSVGYGGYSTMQQKKLTTDFATLNSDKGYLIQIGNSVNHIILLKESVKCLLQLVLGV